MRLFIACPLYPVDEQRLFGNTRKLMSIYKRQSGQEFRIIRKENLHVTLVFLGEKQHSDIAPISRLMLNSASVCKNPIECEFSQLMFFPKMNNPRVLVTADVSGNRVLKRIRTDLLEKMDMTESHRFRPHITIARIPRPSRLSRDELTAIQKMGMPPLKTTLNRIVLYRSQLTPEGASYDPLFTVELGS